MLDITRQDGADYREVKRRVVDFYPSGYVEEHIFLRELEAYTFFKHGEEHIHSLGIKTGALDPAAECRKLRCSLGPLNTSIINGRILFHRNPDCGAAKLFVRVTEQYLRRIGDFAKPLRHISEMPISDVLPKTVFDRAQYTVHIVAVALKLQHCVNYVFQHFRA